METAKSVPASIWIVLIFLSFLFLFPSLSLPPSFSPTSPFGGMRKKIHYKQMADLLFFKSHSLKQSRITYDRMSRALISKYACKHISNVVPARITHTYVPCSPQLFVCSYFFSSLSITDITPHPHSVDNIIFAQDWSHLNFPIWTTTFYHFIQFYKKIKTNRSKSGTNIFFCSKILSSHIQRALIYLRTSDCFLLLFSHCLCVQNSVEMIIMMPMTCWSVET